MRILMQDFGSYPYPWDLSKELANRGHKVLHVVSASEPLRTDGIVASGLEDRLRFHKITIPFEFSRSNLLKRWRWTRQYGRAIASLVASQELDIVVSANSPLDAQNALWKTAKVKNLPKVYWLQDLLGLASFHILARKIPVLGQLIGRSYQQLEMKLLRESDHVISITDGFKSYLERAKVLSENSSTIENWAPIEQLPISQPSNSFAREFSLEGLKCFSYAGQLGMKHNPGLIATLAEGLAGYPEARILMSAVGPGVDALKVIAQQRGIDNIIFIPFQSFTRLPELMACSHALVAMLEEEAGDYCVPSKVLTYLCGQRPILMSAPLSNLSSQIIIQNQAGIVCSPTDSQMFVQAAIKLLENSAFSKYGANARKYAERTFTISSIADRFERILEEVIIRRK